MAAWGHVWFFFNAMLTTAFVPFTLRELEVDAFGLGVAYAFAGVGAVIGGAVAGRAGRRLGIGPAVILADWLFPVSFLLVVLATPGSAALPLISAGQLIFGLAVGLGSPNELAFRQTITPDRLQGRMNATIRSLNWGLIAIGAPLGGLVADRLGFTVALSVGIAGVALAATGRMLSPFRRAKV